jgi:hypothetical protein
METGLTNVFSYAKLALYKNLPSVTPARPISYFPKPTDGDYYNGYIERYFIQKANDTESTIYEVDYIGFSKFIDNPFYTHVNLNWRIIGTDEQIKDSNFKAIRLLAPRIPKLQLYLPNLLQFKQIKNLEV